MNKWDRRYLDLAKYVAHWSKDPSTKVGAAITNPDGTIVSLGFNGFPRGVLDFSTRLNDRPQKYARTVHAEMNAILSAHRSVRDCTLYVAPLFPCSSCAGAIIQAGIARVVAVCGHLNNPDWQRSFDTSMEMFAEAGVEFEVVND